MPASCMPAVARVLTRPASTAPSTETPTAPPKERKNATEALAAPMSLARTVFCTPSTRFCISRPMPIPSSNRKMPASHSDV